MFIGAAGYNACYELLQAGIPGLLVPNTLLADDQARRAAMVARVAPVVVSPCETAEQRHDAISRLLELEFDAGLRPVIDFGGAELAAEQMLALLDEGEA